ADGRWQRVAHRAEPARGLEHAGLVEAVVLGREHLVLADIRHDQRVAAGGLVQGLDHLRLIQFQRVVWVALGRVLDLSLGDPGRRGQPLPSGCGDGAQAMPSRVVTTGLSAFSANAINSSVALEIITPWPARMTGRRACSVRRAALRIWTRLPSMLGWKPGSST